MDSVYCCFASIQRVKQLNEQLVAARREMESYKEENRELSCKLEKLSAKVVSKNSMHAVLQDK